MAPKPGADGLLAPKPKAASAGILPALAVAALLALAGCGGDSGSSTQSAASPQGSAEAPKSQGEATAPSPGEGNKSPAPSSSASNQGNPAAKQGPPITPPKGQPERAPSAAEKANSALASIALQSPDLPATSSSEAKLPATFTCAGKDSWPTLKWSGVPAGSAELVLFVLGLEPVNEALFFNWAVAGLDPSLQGIEAAKLPKGVIVGRNGFGKNGYSICPPKGSAETYIFALYALPQSLSPRRGFDPAALRKEILGLAGNVGLMAAAYGG